jgi:hypothetical protein
MGNWVASVDIENLSRAVASGSNKTAVQAKTHAANNTLMRKVVHEVDIQHTLCMRVEDGKPIGCFLLVVIRQRIKI